ncbi:MAG: ATP-binding protein [Sphingobacteriales bacterium]
MRKLAVTLLLAVLCLNCFAQQKTIDSLKKLIAAAKDDTSRVLAMGPLQLFYNNSKPDSALAIANEMLRISKAVQYKKGEAISLNCLGNVYSTTGNYSKALAYYLSALKLGEQMNDRQRIAGTLGNMGLVYAYENDYRKAVTYFLQSLAAGKNAHYKRVIVVETGNAGDAYEKLNMLDSALWYTRLDMPLALDYKDPDLIGGVYNNLGNIYSKMKQLDTALYYYRKGMPLLKQAADDDAWCETTIGIAKVFQQKGRPDSALYYARQSIAGGWHGGFKDRVLDASTFLTGYFEKQGLLDSAFRYQKVLIAAKDSLFSQEKTREFQNLSFADRQRQQEIQEAEIAYKTSVRYYLLIGVIVLFVVMSIIFWRNNRQNKKAKIQIQNTLDELKTTQAQLVQSAKMASLGELTAGIAHEIQNPLNFVNNFSEVNREMLEELEQELDKGAIGEAKAIAADIKQNEIKINHHGKRADFIVKGMLEHSRTSTGEKQATNINVLAEEFLKLSYHGLRAKDKSFNAELVTNFDNSIPRMNIVQQDIGRVLINLFGNAFYAVNQKSKTAGADYKPTVEVSTTQQNGSIIISVKDNGTGIPENIREKIMQPYFTTKPTGEGTGLGLSLSYDIVVKGHGGKINVESKEGEGSEFTVMLPSN